jgi:hypothetical protein
MNAGYTREYRRQGLFRTNLWILGTMLKDQGSLRRPTVIGFTPADLPEA